MRPIAFRAPAGELLVSGALAQGKAEDEIVEVVLDGRFHDPPIEPPAVDRDSAAWDTPVDTAVSEFYAMKNDDAQWILSNHAEDTREGVLEVLADEVQREQSKAFFAGLDHFYVWAEAYYGPRYAFVIYAIGRPTKKLLGVYTKTPDGWKSTELLEFDETAAVVEAALRAGEIAPL